MSVVMSGLYVMGICAFLAGLERSFSSEVFIWVWWCISAV